MLTSRKLLSAAVLLVAVAAGYYAYHSLYAPATPASTTVSTAPSTLPSTSTANPVEASVSPKPEQTAGGDDSLRALAEQHCGQLGEKANVDACVSQIVQDISAGRTQPIIPTFDADACETIKDPAEQHRCHGQVGRNFAVASGDMKFCDAIPQDEIRVSCRTAIIVNEVKKLYALDNNAAGSIEP